MQTKTRADRLLDDYYNLDRTHPEWGQVWAQALPAPDGFQVLAGIRGAGLSIQVALFHDEQHARNFAQDFQEGRIFCVQGAANWWVLVRHMARTRLSGKHFDREHLLSLARPVGIEPFTQREYTRESLHAHYAAGRRLREDL